MAKLAFTNFSIPAFTAVSYVATVDLLVSCVRVCVPCCPKLVYCSIFVSCIPERRWRAGCGRSILVEASRCSSVAVQQRRGSAGASRHRAKREGTQRQRTMYRCWGWNPSFSRALPCSPVQAAAAFVPLLLLCSSGGRLLKRVCPCSMRSCVQGTMTAQK